MDNNFDFKITEDLIKKATSYVPIEKKVAFCKARATECLEAVEISALKIEADSLLALPPVWQENTVLKQLVLMYGFLTMYLHVDVPEDFDTATYNLYAQSHPINQLERLKTNTAIKDKVFDIIADFKDLKKILDIEIFNLRTARNDGWERALAGIATISSPDTIKEMLENMQKIIPVLKQAQQPLNQEKES